MRFHSRLIGKEKNYPLAQVQPAPRFQFALFMCRFLAQQFDLYYEKISNLIRKNAPARRGSLTPPRLATVGLRYTKVAALTQFSPQSRYKTSKHPDITHHAPKSSHRFDTYECRPPPSIPNPTPLCGFKSFSNRSKAFLYLSSFLQAEKFPGTEPGPLAPGLAWRGSRQCA